MSSALILDRLLTLFQSRQFTVFDAEAQHVLQSNPPDILRIKILGWCAQSKAEQQQREEALLLYDQAIELAVHIEDHDGKQVLSEQRNLVWEQQQALLTPEQTPQNILQEGIALLKTPHSQRAETLLLSSVAQADDQGDPKNKVLSRLALARIPSYQEAMLSEAFDLAQETGDMNLITAVKKTMDQLGVHITPHIF